jgi:methylmalonyl-CoA carboxyltransferase small subunit
LKLKLTIDGKVYEVDVEAAPSEQPQPNYVPPVGRAPTNSPPTSVPTTTLPSAREHVADESKVCRSPIAGVIVKVTGQAGQQIQTGDVLMVLEAMKMETEITSPIAGTIAQLKAQQGDSVQAGQVLIEFV